MIQLRRPTDRLSNNYKREECLRLQSRLHEMGYAAALDDIAWAYSTYCQRTYSMDWMLCAVMDLDKACYAVRQMLEEVE